MKRKRGWSWQSRTEKLVHSLTFITDLTWPALLSNVAKKPTQIIIIIISNCRGQMKYQLYILSSEVKSKDFAVSGEGKTPFSFTATEIERHNKSSVSNESMNISYDPARLHKNWKGGLKGNWNLILQHKQTWNKNAPVNLT